MSEHVVFSEGMTEIVDSFVVETQEIFDELNDDLLRLEQAEDRPPLIDKIFRGVHTVKGTSSFLSLDQLNDLAHHFESVLNQLRKGELEFRPAMMDVLFAAFDRMTALLQQVIDRKIDPLPLGDVIDGLKRLGAEAKPSSLSPAPTLNPNGTHANGAPRGASVNGGGEASASGAHPPTHANGAGPPESAGKNGRPGAADGSGVNRGPRLRPAVNEAPENGPFRNRNTSPPFRNLTPTPGRRAPASIRVDVARIDQIIALVGDLAERCNRLDRIVGELKGSRDSAPDVEELARTSEQMDALMQELRSAVLKTRMVPVERVFSKFPRVARDLGRSLGKSIQIVLEGADVEIDKALADEIGEPLLHLIRNAIDHGIEERRDRLMRSKPKEGRIVLRAEHRGDCVAICVEDDGAGIDPEVIRAKAVARNLVSAEAARKLNDTELFKLIWKPGFTTVNEVSMMSGRGVGMDVVKTTVERMRGTVEISSVPSHGTCVTLLLPLTVSVSRVLIVESGEHAFALQLRDVKEVVAFSETETAEERPVVRVNDSPVPLIEPATVLGVESRPMSGRVVVVVNAEDDYYGLVVDELVGQEEVVVKPERHSHPSTGTAVLADGRAVVVLDAADVAQAARKWMDARMDAA